MTLPQYVSWVQAKGWGNPALHPAPLVSRHGVDQKGSPFLLDVLHRDGCYQVERIYLGPGEVIVHRHPLIHSLEYFLEGHGLVTINSKTYDLAHSNGRMTLPLPATAWHGATVSPSGLLFLSIQRWTQGVTPSSVQENWEEPSYAHS